MIDIILPVFNGEKYIAAQIESILSQELSDFMLYIRDDGSADKTPVILKSYERQYSDKIKLISDGKGNLGVTENVFEILKYSAGEYIAFSDQDDVWMPDKLTYMVESMRFLSRNNEDMPLLVHMDALVANEDMTEVFGTLTEVMKMNRSHCSYVNLARRNIVQGAAMMINRRLKSIAAPLYKEKRKNYMYHDWWFALLASVFGKIHYIDRPGIYYRQHQNNLVGAGMAGERLRLKEYLNVSVQFRYEHELYNDRKRISIFLKNYSRKMTKEQISVFIYLRDTPDSIREFIRLGLQRYYSPKDILIWFLFGNLTENCF